MSRVVDLTEAEWDANTDVNAKGSFLTESQLENQEQGIYHGYPMPVDDDFRDLVLTEWARRE